MSAPDETFPTRGAELAGLLLATFEKMVGQVERELARQGHPGFTAANEFALRVIEAGAENAAELGRRLAVSRQAAAKSIAVLEQLGYVERVDDPADARRKLIRVTRRGYEAHALGASLFEQLRLHWAEVLGASRLSELERTLQVLGGDVTDPWSGGRP